MELLTRLSPDIAFAQNGYRNRYGHPHPLVVARYESLGIPFYQTPRTGAQTWMFREGAGLPVHFLRQASRRLWQRNVD